MERGRRSEGERGKVRVSAQRELEGILLPLAENQKDANANGELKKCEGICAPCNVIGKGNVDRFFFLTRRFVGRPMRVLSLPQLDVGP